MIGALFHTVIFVPLYNGLVFFVGIVPGHDVGIAIILLTILVRILLYPLARRAIESQMAMKKIAPEVEALKKKYKDNSSEQATAMFALYRERGVHPFAGIGTLLLQLPVLIGLYWVFTGGGLPEVDPTKLYPFIGVPAAVNTHFLGFVDMSAAHNIVLALLVAVTQYFYTRLSMGPRGEQSAGEATLLGDMAKSFDIQARYVFPILIAVISYSIASAASLYLLTANIFMIAQEYFVKRRKDGVNTIDATPIF